MPGNFHTGKNPVFQILTDVCDAELVHVPILKIIKSLSGLKGFCLTRLLWVPDRDHLQSRGQSLEKRHARWAHWLRPHAALVLRPGGEPWVQHLRFWQPVTD